MKRTKLQELASLWRGRLGRNRYVINKREKGQRRFFTCKCCGKKFDFGKSVDYVGVVEEWEARGGMCHACGEGLCHCKEKKVKK